MESVALKVREPSSSDWIDADHVGWSPAGQEAPLRFDIPAGPRLRLVGRGPELFAEDDRVLEAFAAAARTAIEGHRLSGQAEEARVLADVDRQRTALLAAVGHDLRTPLAGIKASVSSLRQTDVEWSGDERDELLANIEDSSDRLDAVVRNLLDASRLEAGSLAVRPVAVALDEVVSAAAIDLPEATGQLRVAVPEDLPLVHADPGLLQQVFVNVLDNAVRHGRGDRADHRAGPCRGGHGEDRDRRPRARRSRAMSATGSSSPFSERATADPASASGLSVARGFVEAMGGAMVADATPGGGLTMRIRLRLAEDES